MIVGVSHLNPAYVKRGKAGKRRGSGGPGRTHAGADKVSGDRLSTNPTPTLVGKSTVGKAVDSDKTVSDQINTGREEPTRSATNELIALVQGGDEEAFGQLYEIYKDKVFSIALRFSGDPAVAADISQETFLKLISRIGQFRGDSSFDSWLYRGVVNACMDHHRRGRKLLPMVMEAFDQFRAPERGALDEMLVEEQARQVQEAVRKLPVEQRMAVVLRYTEGLSYDDIAAALECSPGTVASRLNRAHKNLGRRLRHLEEDASGPEKHSEAANKVGHE